MQHGQDAHSVGAAVPIRYALAALREKGIAWEQPEARAR
jgi:hypothetical protein